jgi:hypothetical protein
MGGSFSLIEMTLTKAAPLTVALHRVFWAAPVLLVVVVVVVVLVVL